MMNSLMMIRYFWILMKIDKLLLSALWYIQSGYSSSDSN